MKATKPKIFVLVFYFVLYGASSLREPLSVKVYCNFEKDLCSWRHETQYTSGLRWHHSDMNTVGCEKDDCSFYSDRYLYVTSSDLKENGSFVRIAHYPLNAQVSGDCSLTLKYIANGIGFAKLIVGIRMIGYREPESILVVHTSKASDWYQVKVPLIASYVFTPVIEAVRDSDYADAGPTEGFIAIDDVALSEGCLTRPALNEEAEEVTSMPIQNLTYVSKVELGDMFSNQEEPETLENTEKTNPKEELTKLDYKDESYKEEPYKEEPKNQSKPSEDFEYALPKLLKTVNCEEGMLCEKIAPNCSEKRNQCNFKVDCEDGKDEMTCPSVCDLDEVHDQEQFKQLCGWSQSRLGTRFGTWILISPVYASKYFENFPKVDATKASRSGKYLILNVIKSTQIPSIHLNSPTFYRSRNTCYFTFSYIIYDRSAVFYITLTVEPEKSGSSRRGTSVSLLWKSNILATRATKWRNASAYIGQQSDPFYLTFVRSSAPHSSHGTVALDNLKFNAC